MRRLFEYAILTFILAFWATTAAVAKPKHYPDPPPPPPHGKPAPEVSPSMAVAGLSLLAGSLTVLRARSRK